MLKQSLFAAALALSTLHAGAQSLPAYPFIHATGEAFMYVPPDLGEIDFEIAAHDPSPEAAVAVVQQRVLEIQELLREQGLPDSDIEIRDLRREMRKGADPAAPGYDVKCAVHINVRDLTKWRAVMAPLLSKPNLDAFATTFGSTSRKRVEGELAGQAVKEAQAKAEAMAAGFGKKVGAVAGISSGQLRNLTRAIGLMPGDAYSDRSKRPLQDRSDMLMVTTLKMSQTVDVIFRIK